MCKEITIIKISGLTKEMEAIAEHERNCPICADFRASVRQQAEDIDRKIMGIASEESAPLRIGT